MQIEAKVILCVENWTEIMVSLDLYLINMMIQM
jgi:hypothetical protein